ncbi:MAG: MFS transporter [Actinomycetaceae bacterium]|nr:MFS transporter [Actinomycetaceae bacterium]
MTVEIPNPSSPIYKRAGIATALMFFFAGFTFASFMSRIPTIRDAFELSPASVGNILLLGSIGSVIALPTAGPIAGRFGPRLTVWAGYGFWIAGMTVVVSTYDQHSLALLALGLFISQLGTSMANTTMNIAGGYVEVLSRRRIMPWLHASYSIGTVSAALLGALMIMLNVGVKLHLVIVIGLTIVVMFIAGLMYVPQQIIAHISRDESGSSNTKRTKAAWMEKRTVMIGLMVIGTGMMEGAANDWLALAMVDGFHVSHAQGTATFAFFLAVLTMARLLTPSMQRRWQPRPMLQVFLVIAIGGLFLLALSPWVWLALVGVIAWGFGASIGFPTAASALSTDPKMTAARISVLSTIGYGAFLIGPPLIGYIANFVGYRQAIGFIILPALISLYLARYIDER